MAYVNVEKNGEKNRAKTTSNSLYSLILWSVVALDYNDD